VSLTEIIYSGQITCVLDWPKSILPTKLSIHLSNPFVKTLWANSDWSYCLKLGKGSAKNITKSEVRQ